MHEVTWQSAGPFIAAGGLCKIETNNDFTSILLEVVYGGGEGSISRLAHMVIECANPYYFDLRRTHDCETACTNILDAYLYQDSPLITALKNRQLDGKVDTLYSEHDASQSELNHLEIVGEASINIICSHVSILSSVPASELEAWPR